MMEEDLYDNIWYCLVIRQDLDLSSAFYSHLMKTGALTYDQRKYIREFTKSFAKGFTKKRKVERGLLLDILRRKGNLGYIGFTQALYITLQHKVLKSIS